MAAPTVGEANPSSEYHDVWCTMLSPLGLQLPQTILLHYTRRSFYIELFTPTLTVSILPPMSVLPIGNNGQNSEPSEKMATKKCSVRLRLNKIRQLDYDTAHADKLSALTRFLQMQTGLFRWNHPTTAGPLRSLPGSSAQRPCSSRSLLLKHGMQSKTRTVPPPVLLKLASDFQEGTSQIERINRSYIVLLPPSDQRPISLHNCSIKLISKMLTS
jgi:negative regulator of replication initiation